MLISAILQNAQSVIDLVWVGRLGASAVASVALGGTVVWALFPLLMGVATGTVALVARAFGAGHPREASCVAGQSLMLAVVGGVLSAGLGTLLSGRLLDAFGAEPEVRAGGEQYLRVMLWGSFTVFLLFTGNAALQGAGDARTPMQLMLLANALNIVLDPVLIFGFGPIPRLGVAGAAWATLLAQAAAALLALRYLAQGRGPLQVRLSHWKPQPERIRRLLKIGLPGSGQMMVRSLMQVVLMRIAAGFGTTAVAAYGTGLRIHMMVLMPAFALGGAAATMVGQNLGAGQAARARKSAWLATGLDALFMLGASLLLMLLAPPIIRLFNRDPEVVAQGAAYLRIVSPSYLFAALGIVLGRALNGAGDSLRPMIITLFSLWGLQVPLATTLTRVPDFGLNGLWWAIAVATAVNGLLTMAWFERGHWRHIRV